MTDMACPQCGADTWDNAQKVAEGWKGPLRKCKDTNCGWVQWPPKEKKTPKESAPRKAPPSDDEKVTLFWDSFDAVLAGIKERKLTDMFNPENMCTLTATLFISRTRN